MKSSPTAWILTIGNEIINGVITDTNREFITRELRAAGVEVRGMSSARDDIDEIADALDHAVSRATITICSGGLGPTEDDKTARAAAAFLNAPLELCPEQLAAIEARFAKWNRPMPPSNARQAVFPRGAVPIPNDYGTAPGFMIERDGRVALFFPGVPRELSRMLRERALPALTERFGAGRKLFATQTLIVYGLSESKLGEILADIAADTDAFHLAFLPRFPVIRLRMDASGADRYGAEAEIEKRRSIIESRIAENILSKDGRSMEDVIVAALRDRKLTLGLAESITGGMIGDMITRVPGSSAVFMGSVVSYSNDMKKSLLGVREQTLEAFGAVSHQCAHEMAMGARETARADIGLSVTGIAGPDGGSEEKPVGTFFVGLADGNEIVTRRFCLPGERLWVKTLAAMQALDLLRRRLFGYRIRGEAA
jgi:nicotinamide-nucleotide amidase